LPAGKEKGGSVFSVEKKKEKGSIPHQEEKSEKENPPQVRNGKKSGTTPSRRGSNLTVGEVKKKKKDTVGYVHETFVRMERKGPSTAR